MTIDKEFVTTLIAIAGATAALMSRMGKLVTKDEFTKRIDDLDIKLSGKIENYLRLPHAPKQEVS